MRRAPETYSTAFMCRLMRPDAAKKRLTARPATTNGTPRPSEYAARRPTPWATVSCCDAYNRMAPRMGPMHGVQPNANASPTR